MLEMNPLQAAEEILAEAKETKIAADTQSNITNEHELKLDEIEQRLNELEPNGVVCSWELIHIFFFSPNSAIIWGLLILNMGCLVFPCQL